MIAPSNEIIFNVVPVSQKATAAPESASTEPVTMAIGSAKLRNSISNTANTNTSGHDQHDGQIAERSLLLFVQSAKLDGRVGRDIGIVGQVAFDRVDAMAEIDSGESGRHGHQLTQVLAVQLEHPGFSLDLGHVLQRDIRRPCPSGSAVTPGPVAVLCVPDGATTRTSYRSGRLGAHTRRRCPGCWFEYRRPGAGREAGRAARKTLVRIRIEGPATTRPSFTSTTPGMFSMVRATSVASCLSTFWSLENNLISTGLGDQVRSPIRSLSTPGNSNARAGSAAVSLSRTSSITSAVLRVRSVFSLTRKSPVFGSAIAKASRAPVRREKLLTSGTCLRICFDVHQHAIGLGQARSGPRIIVDDKRTFVHGRQKIGIQSAKHPDANQRQSARSPVRRPDGKLQALRASKLE